MMSGQTSGTFAHLESESRLQREQANSREDKYQHVNEVQSPRIPPAANHLTQLLSQEWEPQSEAPPLTQPITTHPHSAAQAKTQVAQTSTQQTSAKSSSTCNSPTPATYAYPNRKELSGTVALVWGQTAGGAESTALTRRCGITSRTFTRLGWRTPSRLPTGFSFRWSCGRIDW